MKRYYMRYESDRKVCGSNEHTWGFSSSVKGARRMIARCKQEEAENHPRNFRVYDTEAEVEAGQHAPCVYAEP